MAKGQVTDEELAEGLKSLGGGLGGISSTGARRDSPFATPSQRTPQPKPEPPVINGDVSAAVVTKNIDIKLKEKPKAAPFKEVRPELKEAVKAVKPAAPAEKEKPIQESDQSKAESFTERITLQMTPEMRDELNDIARKFQRKKSDKTERITANTLMRSAIQFMLNNLEISEGDRPNNEEEVLKLLTDKLCK